MFDINPCSPIWDRRPGDDLNVRVIRILMCAILVLLYLLQEWERESLLAAGEHVVALGFALMFSPYPLELLLGAAFLAARTAYEVRLHRSGSRSRTLRTALRLLNLALLLCAIVGISRTAFENQPDGPACLDGLYSIPE